MLSNIISNLPIYFKAASQYSFSIALNSSTCDLEISGMNCSHKDWASSLGEERRPRNIVFSRNLSWYCLSPFSSGMSAESLLNCSMIRMNKGFASTSYSLRTQSSMTGSRELSPSLVAITNILRRLFISYCKSSKREEIFFPCSGPPSPLGP